MSLAHENLLPALDRCYVVLTRLRGLAKYHDGISVFNVSPEDLTRMLETLSSLRLLAHNVLLCAGEERRQFAAFSRWLRHEIDVRAMDPTSASAEEIAERDAGVDYSLLLAYVRGALTQSSLEWFLHTPEPKTGNKDGGRSPPAYEDVKKAVEQQKRGVDANRATLSLASSCAILTAQVVALFAKITSWQAGSSTMDCGVVLEEERTTSARDMRTIHEVSHHTESTSIKLFCR